MAFFYKKLSGVEKTNIASIRLKIPFPEKSKLSYNKEYGLFGLRRRKREEGRRKKEEGKGQKEEGKGQKEKGRRFFPLPLSPSPPLPPLPPLPSPPLPPHPILWRAISRKALSVAKSSTEIYNAALKP
ncbi:hypothetical protein [Microcoleus sp. PH2017_09_SFU_O_A]|uniref:hypothetical protein n=1 Tax=Microcoleus sp. PH2017_09_SFU_O_A TaxID=2798820 RepID=UPI001D975689|nr:hypothetical protein [Microcoleus sp. PH2017_09_SFU_O_A]MCC3446170.1 hypothetical protein [Microcoleus sp. PH2017_09_SFU_O_A]